jgi:septum site-determining protein MinD
MVKRGDMMSVADVLEILSVSLLGIVPEDEFVVVATNRGEPAVLSRARSGQAYLNIARRMLGEDVPFLVSDSEDNGLLGRLLGLLRPRRIDYKARN